MNAVRNWGVREKNDKKKRTHPDEIQHGGRPIWRTHVGMFPDAIRIEHGNENKAEAQGSLGTEFARVR